MLIAFIYDLFRIKRKAVRTANILIYIEDFIYWIIVAVVMFTIVYYSNEGEIRGYTFIGTVVGAVLYALLLSKLVVASFLTVIRVIGRVLLTIWNVAIFPVKFILRLLYYPGRFVGKAAGKMFRKSKRMGRRGMGRIAIWGRIFRNMIKKI
jgi:spore cortex biosynthesis protein YabQ